MCFAWTSCLSVGGLDKVLLGLAAQNCCVCTYQGIFQSYHLFWLTAVVLQQSNWVLRVIDELIRGVHWKLSSLVEGREPCAAMTQRAACHMHTQHWDLNTTQFTRTIQKECRSVYFEKNLEIQTQLLRTLDQLCCIKEGTRVNSSLLLITHISPSLGWEEYRIWFWWGKMIWWLSLHVSNNLVMSFMPDTPVEYLWLGRAARWSLFGAWLDLKHGIQLLPFRIPDWEESPTWHHIWFLEFLWDLLLSHHCHYDNTRHMRGVTAVCAFAGCYKSIQPVFRAAALPDMRC